ncbi:MAG: hypothetical protein AB2761_18945 [Candidatus Thiodiazotropha endolucinida]
MLGAAPEKNGSLELVRLALQLVRQNHLDDISAEFRTYFHRVVHEAKDLNADPAHVNPGTLPESIELALRMKLYEDLSRDLARVEDLNKVTPELANDLLRKMENQPVYTDQLVSAP